MNTLVLLYHYYISPILREREREREVVSFNTPLNSYWKQSKNQIMCDALTKTLRTRLIYDRDFHPLNQTCKNH